MDKNSDTKGLVKSDQTLFSIIEQLCEHESQGVTEISEALNLSKSSVHKHLKTLEENGYVRNNDGRYKLGFKFLRLGGIIRDHNDLCNHARQTIRNITEKTDHMVSFVYKEQMHGVFVYIRNDQYGLRNHVPLGNRFFLHQNGSGKSILAKMTDKQVESYIDETGLPAATENTIIDRDVLWENIETVREQGYAISNEERVRGVQSVATAVTNPSTGEIGSITVIGPADHLAQEHIHSNYAEMLVDTANQLQLQIRYNK